MLEGDTLHTKYYIRRKLNDKAIEISLGNFLQEMIASEGCCEKVLQDCTLCPFYKKYDDTCYLYAEILKHERGTVEILQSLYDRLCFEAMQADFS